ncbi:MAG: MCE family protein [Actinomycetota bacterium]|nr:MCE family protein [Actinomycetota bacterium]
MRNSRTWVAVALVALLVAGVAVLVRATDKVSRVNVVAYFENSNGIYVGDDVRILGVRVGSIEAIEPQPEQVKITFWYDDRYEVPADAMAAILSPALVTSRAIQLTPAYTGGPVMADDTVIPIERTAVPVEWDQVRRQLQVISETLQPTEPGGVSPLGSAINTTADNLRGQGANIRDTVVKLSQAFSALGDHSTDIFSTVKNLATLVSALQDSTDLMRQLNQNLASVTGLLADDPDEVGRAVSDLNAAVGEVQSFVAENRDALGTTSEKLAGVTQALNDSLDDVKQFLHVAPNTFQNYVNIWQPAQGSVSSVPQINNFANPIQFLCGAVQAASRLGAEQSAKLCVQYLAPIIKNRQYNFPPLGLNQLVGASTRPNELTYSEDWLRPDYIPPAGPPPPGLPTPLGVDPLPAEAGPAPAVAPNPGPGPAAPSGPTPDTVSGPLLPAEAVPTNPDQGLMGMMVPAGGGS